jgi:HEPN domain-containing protein
VTEKAIKAFLYAQGEEIVLGHSVARLCADAARYQPRFAEKARRWSLLDGYYIPTRYPSGLPDGIPAEVYTQDAAFGAVALAEEAVVWVEQLLAQSRQGSGEMR